MFQGVLKSGFEVKIPDEAIDNMELLDTIVEMDSNPLAVCKVTQMLLGDDQRRRLYDHLRTEKGNVPVTAVSDAVAEIFQVSQAVKN